MLSIDNNYLHPPFNYGYVDDGIHRSGLPTPLNYSFLSHLKLRTLVFLSTSSDVLDEGLVSFLASSNIVVRTIHCSSPVAEDSVVECLRMMLDVTNTPLLVCCLSGRDLTGTHYLFIHAPF